MAKRLGALLGLAALFSSTACTPDLNVTNPNNPDIGRALASPSDVQSLAISSVNSWYLTSTYVDPYLMLQVTSDASSANFGNFGMRFNNLEPRIAYNNQSAGVDAEVAREPWDQGYATLGAANDVLRAFGKGIQLDTPALTDQYKSLAMFVQAAEMTNLALIFDRAFVTDETFDPSTSAPPQLQSYKDVAKVAQTKWDALIAATNGKTYEYGDQVLPLQGVKWNATTMNRVANTMAALLLAYTPRGAADVAGVDWAKVLQYADKGIGTGSAGAPFDFVVKGDFNNWYSYINYYGNEPSWVRVDMKLINKMDPTLPAKYTGPSDIKPPSGTGDARLGDGTCSQPGQDYKYAGNVIGDPSRGVYMQTPYWHCRYYAHARTSATRAATPVPYLLAAESDLVKAEAIIRTGGDLATAASLINNTRVNRGKLPPATAADGPTQLLQDIAYERDVELLNTNGFTLFQHRHTDDLQPGTVRHLPIPGKELETLQLPYYTFGGVGQPDRLIATPSGAMVQLHRAPRTPRPIDMPAFR